MDLQSQVQLTTNNFEPLMRDTVLLLSVRVKPTPSRLRNFQEYKLVTIHKIKQYCGFLLTQIVLQLHGAS